MPTTVTPTAFDVLFIFSSVLPVKITPSISAHFSSSFIPFTISLPVGSISLQTASTSVITLAPEQRTSNRAALAVNLPVKNGDALSESPFLRPIPSQLSQAITID